MKKLDYLNRDQLQKIHRLGQVRNANRILKGLSDYLSSFRNEYSTIYYLNAEGRDYVNTEKVRKKTQFVNHVIMRNYFYMYVGMPTNWKNEVKISDGKNTVIADAYYSLRGMTYFLEVDSCQKMSENRKKIEEYKGLYHNGLLSKHIGHFPMLIWVTTTDLRVKQISKLCEGLMFKVIKIDDIKGA